MARTIQQIFDSIEAEKNASSALSDLTSPSQTAIWRVWAFIVAAAIWAHETLWDMFWTEVQTVMNRNVVGTLPWYREKALQFQYNPSQPYFIVFDEENRPVYDIIAPADRIITHAAAVESFNSIVIVKAAKSVSGVPVPLTSLELQSFKDYMFSMKFAGTRLKCISTDPDKISVFANIYYDPIAPFNAVSIAVEEALNLYLNTLPFNGIVYVEKVQNAIQSVKGVVSVEIVSVNVDYGNGVLPITRVHQTLAGYCTINSAFPLSSTLSYNASNV